MAFRVLLYTDCSPSESVHGREGFQFHAEGRTVTVADEQIVKGLLYVAPHSLMMAGTPVPEFPGSCAYTMTDGGHYLTRGRYLGQVAGGREGNQITECLATNDPNDILPLRPAQLYSTAAWDLSKRDSTTVDDVVSPLRIDPAFEVAALHQMATAVPDASRFLPGLLTMLEQAVAQPRTRLILSHPDLDVVMRWIALLTVFLDPAEALSTSFNAFSANPIADGSSIIGASPAVSTTPVDVQRLNGLNGADLTTFALSPIEISSSAALQARWFLGGDPYGALDALSVRRRWEQFMPAHIAAGAAGLACLEGLPASEEDLTGALTALSILAAAGADEDLENYGDALADAIATSRPDSPVEGGLLVTAIGNLDRARQHELSSALTLAALERAAADPPQGVQWSAAFAQEATPDQRAAHQWSDPDARHHAAELLSEFLNLVPADDLPACFELGSALGTGIPADSVQGPIHQLASVWSREPALSRRTRHWLHNAHVVRSLYGQLGDRLGEPAPNACVDAIRAGSWDWLAEPPWEFDPQSPLSPWLSARQVAKADPATRADIMRDVVDLCADGDWRAFFLNAADAHPALLRYWIDAHPSLDPELAALLETVITTRVASGQLEGLDSLLGSLSHGRTSGCTVTTEHFVHDYRQLAEIIARVGTTNGESYGQLVKVPESILLMGGLPLADVLLADSRSPDVIKFLKSCPVDLGPALKKQLTTRLEVSPQTWFWHGLRFWGFRDGIPISPARSVQEAMFDWWARPGYQADRHKISTGGTGPQRRLLGEFLEAEKRRRVGRGVERSAWDRSDRRRP